mmetsp:Transcript_47383/g.74886  ORF Transcript_47383/g.74886 Transcript_47383/m.74886 type:complete len:171 (-) Transcript_47383:129-641(-)
MDDAKRLQKVMADPDFQEEASRLSEQVQALLEAQQESVERASSQKKSFASLLLTGGSTLSRYSTNSRVMGYLEKTLKDNGIEAEVTSTWWPSFHVDVKCDDLEQTAAEVAADSEVTWTEWAQEFLNKAPEDLNRELEAFRVRFRAREGAGDEDRNEGKRVQERQRRMRFT